MSNEATEDDAAMAFVLHGKIEELVRKHILEAFNDPDFMDHLAIDFLHRKLEKYSYGGGSFAQAVRGVIAQQMNKY
jgi:hypothetical protein